MLINEKYTDCSFLVDNGTCIIHGHRMVLAAASPVFEAMFYGPFAKQRIVDNNDTEDQSVVTIVDVSAKIFRAMLDYVYTDETEWSALSNYDLLELYYCMDKYLIRKEDILQRIRGSLNCNSLFLFYDFAIRFKVPLLLADCRQLLHDLLDKKPQLFFKKVLQVNCDRVISGYEEVEGISNGGSGGRVGEEDTENGPAVKRKPRMPIEYIEDVVFNGALEHSHDDDPLGQYHQVSKECLNDLLVLNYDDANNTFNENLLLFVLKWTKIEWKLEHKGQGQRLPLQKMALLNYFKSFVCHKRTAPLVENLMAFLDNHCHLNTTMDMSVRGWHLVQRVDLKACRPLTISSSSSSDSVPTEFLTKFQVNHVITIKSFIINSRLNNAIVSRFMRSTATHHRQFVYKESVAIEISARDMKVRGGGAIVIHRQQFHAETEFNAQCELFLNKCLYFCPDQVYTLRFVWPQDAALTCEYPRKVYERCQSVVMAKKQLSLVFMDDAVNSDDDDVIGHRETKDQDMELLPGGILSGMQFMFVS